MSASRWLWRLSAAMLLCSLTGGAGAVPTDLKPPQDYSPDELRAAIERRVASSEQAMVVNPLAGDPAITRWAEELVGTATEPETKARLIYQALCPYFRRNVVLAEAAHNRTAIELAAARDQLCQSFSCREATWAYVALARSVGLQAYAVWVDRLAAWQKSHHFCAVVFLDGKGVLVDPENETFGMDHLNFTILDDLQAVAIQTALSGPEPLRRQVASKLDPNSAHFRQVLAMAPVTPAETADLPTVRIQMKKQKYPWYVVFLTAFALSPSPDIPVDIKVPAPK